MCGICGFCGSGTIDDLKRMNNVLSHRGPDAEGYWTDQKNGIYIAHKRLSIVDISDGTQPMWTMDNSLCVTFNGEIYNHNELRKQLENKGHIFFSDHSDTEVLLHGYRQWGSELPSKLNGMWAFAIYDTIKRCFFLSRDRFGKKPLFYTLCSGTFIFGSELSAVSSHSCFNHSISILSLQKYFAYNYIPAPGSIYESVYKLPAGYNLIYDIAEKRTTLEKYWEFTLEPFDHIPHDAEEVWGEQLRELLGLSVKRRLASDVPLGVFLSGGIDSSSISYFASHHYQHDRIKTFSIGFEESSFDESVYALYVSDYLKTDHHHKILSLDSAKTLLPDIIAKLDEPIGDSSLLPTYLLCKECKQLVTVALGGDGADELFAGYDPFKALGYAEWYKRFFPRPLHKAIKLIIERLPVSHDNMSFDFKLKRTINGLEYPKHLWNPVWLSALEICDINCLFNQKIDIEELYSESIECWESCEQSDIIDKTLQFYTRIYLQNDILTKIDRASMMNSLEVRAPFLDIDLVNFIRKIPSNYKFRGGETKYILKKALQPILPKSILFRKKKGFGVPVGKWFKNNDLNLTVSSVPSSTFNNSFIKRQTDTHRTGISDNRIFLWNMWILEKFSR